ncbi:MAG: hypothetical protein M9962_02530 [Oligoflexia bacterium]|nr:hypothetical protein [Oligoflexia bacterium]
MKKLIYAPLLIAILLVGFSSCGKKDEGSTAAVAPVAPAPGPVTPGPVTPGPGVDFSYWCQSQLGTLSSDGQRCAINHNIPVGFTLVGMWTSTVYVYTGDLVTISASGSPRVYVGGSDYGRVGSFQASNQGYLAFSDSFATVNYISIRRCYNSYQQAISCY